MKKNNIKNINQTNFSFLLHQVSKNLNKTFSTLYENNNNRSLSSNNSLNNSIETNNTINFPQRKYKRRPLSLNIRKVIKIYKILITFISNLNINNIEI